MSFTVAMAKHILRPVVELLVKHGLVFRETQVILKELYVELAERELKKVGRDCNASRLSAITGIARDEIGKILMKSGKRSFPTLSVSARVLGQWEQDARFCKRPGLPRILSYRG